MKGLREEAAFIDAVMDGLKKQPEGNLVMIDARVAGRSRQSAANTMATEAQLPCAIDAGAELRAAAVRWMPMKRVPTIKHLMRR